MVLVGLKREAIIVPGLPLYVAHIILARIFFMSFYDFEARGLKSIPVPPVAALTEFFRVDASTNVHPLPGPWYFCSSLIQNIPLLLYIYDRLQIL